jgi:hypothetical protein
MPSFHPDYVSDLDCDSDIENPDSDMPDLDSDSDNDSDSNCDFDDGCDESDTDFAWVDDRQRKTECALTVAWGEVAKRKKGSSLTKKAKKEGKFPSNGCFECT